MISKHIRKAILVSITCCMSNAAMANWPVAITDTIAVHPGARTDSNQRAYKEFEVLDNDIGQDLQIIGVNDWTEKGGRAKILGGFALSYSAPENFEGEDGFWYAIKDSEGRTNSVRVSVNVLPANSPLPALQDDNIQTPRDKPIRINVLKNDVWPLAASNSSFIVTLPTEVSKKGGKIESTLLYPGQHFSENNQLIYTPPPGFVGTDTFKYFAQSSADQPKKEAEVTVEVLKNNTFPLPYPTVEPVTVNLSCPVGVSECFDRPPIDVLNNEQSEFVIKLDSNWSQKGGKVEISRLFLGSPAILYRPAPDFEGEDKVWFVIEDQYFRRNWSSITINVELQEE